MTDKIRINCRCGKSLSVDLQLAGKSIDCPRCGDTLRVPVPALAGVGDAWGRDETTAQNGSKPTSAGKLWGDKDDFLSQHSFANSCPVCGSRMADHAVVCLDCGHNKRAGKAPREAIVAATFPSFEQNLPVCEEVAKVAESDSASGGKALAVAAVVAMAALAVGSFYSKGVGLAAVLLALVSIFVSMGYFVVGAFVELTHNAGARRNMLNSLMMTLLALPLGMVVVRRHCISPKAQRINNRGWLFGVIGLVLLFSGAIGVASQKPRKPKKPIPKAPVRQPVEKQTDRVKEKAVRVERKTERK